MLKLVISGGTGRLGREIVKKAGGFEILGVLSRTDDIRKVIKHADVVIDVSVAENVEKVLKICEEYGKPLVIGTTGHEIDVQGVKIPVLLAANFSIGMNVLYSLAREAANLLGGEFRIEIIDKHHQWKKDAPSGSAKILRKMTGGGEIRSIREGETIGEHDVLFFGEGERIEIGHRVEDRGIFATGALKAAEWIVGRAPGVYCMQDILKEQ